MDPQRWQRIQELFHAAVELPEGEREAFVVAACKDDPDIGRELLAMLDEDKRGVSRLGREVAHVVDRVLAGAGTSASFMPPERIGPYLREQFLGRGGMGLVWKYLRVDTGQPMAVKFLSLPLSDPLYEERRRRFAEEINMLARLRHPHIVAFHDAGALDDGTQWFVMDYVEEFARGKGYTEYIRQSGRLVEARLRHFRTVCEAVLYAHRQGILHRDLKPSNILVDRDESPRIVDFGIARPLPKGGEAEDPTSPTSRFMSPDYAAPEWKRGAPGNVATDVYALGVILYELLAGRHPYRDPAQPAALFDEDKTHELPEKPSVVAAKEAASGSNAGLPRSAWSDLDKLCLTAMHPDPNERYKSVESLIREIDHYLNDEPLEALPGKFSYRAGKFVRKYRQAVLASSAALLLIVGVTVFFTVRLARARDAAVSEAARSRRIEQFMLNLLGASDEKAAPEDHLRVVTLLDHGVQEAGQLAADPAAQSDLYENLGNMYDMLGEFSKADKLLLLALDRRRNAPGSDDARTAEILVQVGVVLADAARDPLQFKHAERYVQQGLDLVSRKFSGNDPRVLSATAAFGRVIAESGDFQRAIALLQPFVQREPNGTQADFALSDAWSTLIGSYYDVGNISQAEKLTSRSLALDRRLYGPDHPQVALDLVDAGLNKAAVSHYAEAEPYYRQAINIERAWYGPDHPDTAEFESLLARALHEQGKLAESQAILLNALQVQEHAYGNVDPRVAVTLDTLGEIQMDRGDLAGAQTTFEQAVDIDQKVLGSDNYQTAIIDADLGETYRREKQYDRANTVLAESVKTLQATLPAGAFNTGIAQLSWGRALLALRHYSAAEQQLSAAYAAYKAQDHPSATDLEQIRRDLLTTFAALDEKDKELRLRADIANEANANKVQEKRQDVP